MTNGRMHQQLKRINILAQKHSIFIIPDTPFRSLLDSLGKSMYEIMKKWILCVNIKVKLNHDIDNTAGHFLTISSGVDPPVLVFVTFHCFYVLK